MSTGPPSDGPAALPDGLDALREGTAYVDLSSWRKIHVNGPDAGAWLNDLITADIGSLAPGRAVRSLLLTPTGRIRADVLVAPVGDGFLLVQDLEQPASIGDLLAPYVLSSAVRVEDRTAMFALLAHAALPQPIEPPPAARWAPSAVGLAGDLLFPATPPEAVDAARTSLAAAGLVPAGLEALEAWRIERGVARFGVDLLEDSLPHEAGLDQAIAADKGCFLGQESVAKVRNLGHPPNVVLAAVTAGLAGAGDALTADGRDVGLVTSATPLPDGRTAAIVRVRWDAREATLTAPGGAGFEPRGPASGQPRATTSGQG